MPASHPPTAHTHARPLCRSLDAGAIIHSLVFSPNRYWLVAATQSGIKVGHAAGSACGGVWVWG